MGCLLAWNFLPLTSHFSGKSTPIFGTKKCKSIAYAGHNSFRPGNGPNLASYEGTSDWTRHCADPFFCCCSQICQKPAKLSKSLVHRRPPASNPYQSDIRVIWLLSHCYTPLSPFAAQSCNLPHPPCPVSSRLVSSTLASSVTWNRNSARRLMSEEFLCLDKSAIPSTAESSSSP